MDGAHTTQTRLFPTGCGQDDTHATILHDGRPNPSAEAGQPYATIDGVGIVRMMRDPPRASKEDAAWFIPSTYAEADARSHAAQKAHGLFELLAIDVDEGDLSIDQVTAALDAVVRGARRRSTRPVRPGRTTAAGVSCSPSRRRCPAPTTKTRRTPSST